VGRAAQLADGFRKRNLPVVLVNVSGRAPGRTDFRSLQPALSPDWTEIVPELRAQPTDYLVSKQRPGAFIGTSLDAYLRGRAMTQVVLAGVATSSGVESTARSAFDLGYNVAFVTDAMADRDAEAHRNSVEKIFPRLGESATTKAVLALLDQAHN